MPSLPALPAGPERVVIRKDDEVQPGSASPADYIGNPARTVGIGGVDVDSAGVFEPFAGAVQRSSSSGP